MKSGSEDEVIFQFVPCTFLHLQSTVSVKSNGERGHGGGRLTRNLLAVLGSITFRMSCTS